jgi:putative alpha-1,2-mannosidase
MSAFAVFSMMGFYPVTPGVPIYDIGSPIFDKVTIHLKNGNTFVIVANLTSHENKYVESIRLNGKALDQVWFRHADIANGGRLELTMGDSPNTSLGSSTSSFPPASIEVHPEDYSKSAEVP